jgi:predicted phage baseplate assembly protein
VTLPAPNLDDRRFEELLAELRQLIPTYTPELALGSRDWTDWNESDPGTTLLQLWAHLAETILYRLNRLPDRAYVKFLELVGLRLRPARPATGDLTFTPQPGFSPRPPATGVSVPPGTQVRAQPTGGGELLTFETDLGLDLVRAELASVQVTDGGGFIDVTELNGPDGSSFRPLGWTPQPGNALYLGFAPPDPPVSGRVFPPAIRLRAFAPLAPGRTARCAAGAPAPLPPVTLEWEYRRSTADPRWRRLEVYEDGTAALTRGGYLLVAGPAEIEAVPELGVVSEPRLWLRCRLGAGAYPTNGVPELDFLWPNTVPAVNLASIRHEVVGESEGHPDQTFQLRKVPMQPDTLMLEVEQNGEFRPWERVDDLLASGPEDCHYAVDGASGTLIFGDGRRGRIPLAGNRIVARQYRHGASAAGNLPAGLVSTLAVHLAGVQGVANPRPTVGGADVQRLDDLRRDAPAELRSLRRAVTGEDFVALARQVGTVARARALPLAHPDHRNVEVPGAVTVVVVPDGTEVAPEPSPELLEEVCRHLDARRTIATELYVVGPRYRRITVLARVEAESPTGFDLLRLAVVGAIDAVLDPLGRPAPSLPGEGRRGGARGPGRDFGRDLAPTSLYSVIGGVAGVAAVPHLQIDLDGSPWDDLSVPIVLEPDELLYGAGDHQISVVPRQERAARAVP